MGLKLDLGSIVKDVKNTVEDAATNVGAVAQAVGETAGEIASQGVKSVGNAAKSVGENAGTVFSDVKNKFDNSDEKEPDEYELAIIDYNLAYTDLNDIGISLLKQRERSIDSIELVEYLINSIANTPKSFQTEIEQIQMQRQVFKDAEAFVAEELQFARKTASNAGAGVAAGVAVASLGPSAAMWVATTFGTASTGAAISTLSGAAANSAALAWLGGGALATGGGGAAAGSALLTLAGPVGWGIAGATVLTSVVLFSIEKRKIATEKDAELTSLKVNAQKLRKTTAELQIILEQTQILRENTGKQFVSLAPLYGKNFSDIPTEDQQRLGALVNNTLSLSVILNKKIDQDNESEQENEI